MEAASRGIRAVLEFFTEEGQVDEALIKYVKQLEKDYEEVQDITLFIFAVRSFFCWHRAPELLQNPALVANIRRVWFEQNDTMYTRWLSSANDEHEDLKWSKWTFQAKNSILNEFLKEGKA
jgi:hypothetical protein